MRNLVICLDGTGNQVRASSNTNVVLLYTMLDLSDPQKQVAYYDAGPGTFSSGAAWSPLAKRISKLSGLAFGVGLRENLGQVYGWLMRTWEPGDRVFVFGFSRGAYTARALTGMLRTVGLARPGLDTVVPYAVQAHTRRFDDRSRDDYWATVHTFAEVFAQQTGDGRRTVPVHYLGIWDTVKAAGLLRWQLHWPYTNKLPNVQRCRHAMSIDEKRRPYELKPVSSIADGGLLEQAWFAGVHSDVGGTFEDDGPKLSTIPLKWVAEGAVRAGLLVTPTAYDRECTVTPAHAEAAVHRMGRIWALATYKHREVPDGAAVHASVGARRQADPAYGRGRFLGDVTYVDPDWTGRPRR